MGTTVKTVEDYRRRMKGQPTLDEEVRGPFCSSPSACSTPNASIHSEVPEAAIE